MKKNKKHLEEELKKLQEQMVIIQELSKFASNKEHFDLLQEDIASLARRVSILQFEVEGGKVASVRVCGLQPHFKGSLEIKCDQCWRACYYDPEIDIMFSKKAKNICPFCALKKKDLTENQRKILEKITK